MDIDLPYLLFWAVVVSGLIIMTDLLFLKSRRERSALIGFVAQEDLRCTMANRIRTELNLLCAVPVIYGKTTGRLHLVKHVYTLS